MPRDPEREADGLAVDAWRTSQSYWKNGRQLIPEDVWAAGGFEPLITVGLAERRADGVYVRGSAAHHEWIEKKNRGAKKGGETRKTGHRDGRGRFGKLTSLQLENVQPATSLQLENVQPATSPPAPAPALGDNSYVYNETSGDGDTVAPEPSDYGEPVVGTTRRRTLRYEEGDLRLAKWVYRQVLTHAPWGERLADADPEAWANDLRVMREADGIPLDLLQRVLLYAFDDDFWKRTVQSPSGARRNWRKLLKGYDESLKGYNKMLGANPADFGL